MIPRIQPCLWFDGNAEEAARFYADTFPDSRIDAIGHAPGDYPAGKQGNVLIVQMTILGMPFLLLNGGPQFTFDEAVRTIALRCGGWGDGPLAEAAAIYADPAELLDRLDESPLGRDPVSA